MTIKIEVTDKTIKAKLQSFVNDISNNSITALTEVANHIKTEATKITPIDTGNLRDSAYVLPRRDDVILAYRANYAAYVHERTDIKFKIGKSRFLIDTIEANRENMRDIFFKELRQSIKSR